MIEAFASAPSDKKFVFLTGDLGFKALEPLREVMQEYFINAGISEQNMISTAAGLAKSGITTFAYSIAPFIYARPFEQIRNDICLHDLPVTLIGNGGGYGYGVMGATHHAIEDYGSLLCLQNMQAFIPAFDCDISPIISQILHNKKPSYLRLGVAKNNDEINKIPYSSWRKILSGNAGTLVITGSITSDLLAEFLNEDHNNRPNIWVISQLPIITLDENFIADIQQSQKLCILEEHVAQGGIAQMIALQLLKNNITPKYFTNFCAQGYVSGAYGSQDFHRQESQLTKSAIQQFLQFHVT